MHRNQWPLWSCLTVEEQSVDNRYFERLLEDQDKNLVVFCYSAKLGLLVGTFLFLNINRKINQSTSYLLGHESLEQTFYDCKGHLRS